MTYYESFKADAFLLHPGRQRLGWAAGRRDGHRRVQGYRENHRNL